MFKKIIISILAIFLLFPGLITFAFIYSEQVQKIIINSFELKSVINKKVKNYISEKINDKDLIVNTSEIKFLEPNWPNLIRFTINKIKIKSLKQEEESSIKFIEIGLSYNDIIKIVFPTKANLSINYLDLKNITLTATYENNEFFPGPIIKILSGITYPKTSNRQNFKTILNNKILIEDIKFSLIDKRANFKEHTFLINCKDVILSKALEHSRTINMKCSDNNRAIFSITGELGKKINRFYGDFYNINPNLLFKLPAKFNLNYTKQKISINLNGDYNFITDKNFTVTKLDLKSKNSSFKLHDNKNLPILETIFKGDFLWDKKENNIKSSNISFQNISNGSFNFDLASQKGVANFRINKMTLKYLKDNLTNYKDFYSQFINFNSIKTHFKKLQGGSLNDANFYIEFFILKKFELINIRGRSKFKNIRYHLTNKYFKSILSTISGNLKFNIFPKNNKIIINQSWLRANIDASDGNVFLRSHFFEYKFDKAKINVKINNENFNISKAEFFINNQKEYIIKDLKINKQRFSISKVEFIRDNLIDYTLENVEINNSIINKAYLKVRNNEKISKYLKKNLNVDLIGKTNLNFSILGNINKLDYNLNLTADLTEIFLKVNSINILKKKNIQSSIKSEIIFKRGKLESINNTILNIEGKNFKTKSILFENNEYNNIFFKGVDTPKLNLNEIKVSKLKNRTTVYASGKKIDLSYLTENIKKKSAEINEIIFDLIADEIILYPQVSISGNLKGSVKKSMLECTAFGKMKLGNFSLLDAGKLKIFVSEKVAKLDGIGLTGGAETKINLLKIKNQFPQITFDTSDGGKLLNALDFTSNVRSGEMQINVKFLNNFYNEYEGNIKAKKFSLVNTPGIINSLSVMSFTGIQSVISGEGVSFDNGQAKIYFKDKIFNFDKVYLSSESLGLAARGNINLENDTIDLTGSVAPIKLISRIISVVPAIGELITGLKKEGLFAGQFKMTGSIGDPKVKLNTLSFAPGILREIFSDDWLDQDNFFVKNKLN